jgi:hypothetical protein
VDGPSSALTARRGVCRECRGCEVHIKAAALHGHRVIAGQLEVLGITASPFDPRGHHRHADTILRWHRQLIVQKWTYPRRQPGWPWLLEIRRRLVRMASDNPGWGYPRIQGALKNLGHRVARSTIAAVLKAERIPPSGERPMLWRTFLRAHSCWHRRCCPLIMTFPGMFGRHPQSQAVAARSFHWK